MRRRKIETTEMLKKNMGTALLELMKEKPLKKITIEELTKKADVGRATFFRHFKTKEDLISYILLEMYKDYMAERKDDGEDEFLHGVNFFDFYRSTFDIHTMLIESQNENAIFNAYLHFFSPDSKQYPSKQKYIYYYIAYGLFGTTMKWLKDGCKESSEEMAKLCLQLISSAKQE